MGMFTVMLFMGALMLMFSMYTLYIYPNWMPMFSSVDDHVIFLFGSGFQSYSERGWKIAWAIFPNLALMYTALLPSLRNGYQWHKSCHSCAHRIYIIVLSV